jgi:hypothetical protein
VPGRAEKEPGALASGGAGRKADDRGPGWDVGTPGEVTSSWVKEIAARAPVNGGGEPARDRSVDWAKPQASEPAADWDRLSLSVSGTGSWNAFAAATPAKREPAEAAEERQRGKLDQAAGQSRAGTATTAANRWTHAR